MSGNVKPGLEKKIDVEKVIDKILKASGLKIEEFLFQTGISLDSYRKMVDRRALTKPAIESILDIFNLNDGFLTGRDEELNYQGKRTPVQNEAAIKGNHLRMDLSRAIQTVIEDNTEYLIIPKVVLEGKYRLVAIEQIEKDRAELEQRTAQIDGLHDLIKQITHDITARPINIQFTGIEKTK